MLESVTKDVIEELIRKNEMQLASTHARLCIPVINRIYKKMSAGIKFTGIKIENNVICDGHHRYVASLLANFPLDKLPGKTTSATVVVDWKLVEFEQEDWDTEAKIRMWNEHDAEFNNIPIEKVIDLLK
jgi:hypothetical protein